MLLLDEQFDVFMQMMDDIPFLLESLRDNHDMSLLLKATTALWDVRHFRFLILFVRDFTIVNKRGWNVLHCIAHHSNAVDMFELIKQEMTFETLNLLINQLDEFGTSTLHRVSLCNNHNAIKWLITNGAKLNVKDNEGRLPEEQYGCNDETQELIRQHRIIVS